MEKIDLTENIENYYLSFYNKYIKNFNSSINETDFQKLRIYFIKILQNVI